MVPLIITPLLVLLSAATAVFPRALRLYGSGADAVKDDVERMNGHAHATSFYIVNFPDTNGTLEDAMQIDKYGKLLNEDFLQGSIDLSTTPPLDNSEATLIVYLFREPTRTTLRLLEEIVNKKKALARLPDAIKYTCAGLVDLRTTSSTFIKGLLKKVPKRNKDEIRDVKDKLEDAFVAAIYAYCYQ